MTTLVYVLIAAGLSALLVLTGLFIMICVGEIYKLQRTVYEIKLNLCECNRTKGEHHAHKTKKPPSKGA